MTKCSPKNIKREPESQLLITDIFISNNKGKATVKKTRCQETNTDTDHSIEAHRNLASKCLKYVGAHVSAAGGADKSIENMVKIAGQSLALFLKSSRSWNAPPLQKSTIDKFRENCKIYNIDYGKFCLPHGSYLINLGNPDEEKRSRMFSAFVDELQRCESLGIRMYNFHPGSTVGKCSKKESIKYISDCINEAHSRTDFVITVLENCAEPKCVGYKFKELSDIIELVKDKKRVGVCLDTCHLFAAGYDVRTKDSFDSVMKDFEETVGMEYLCAMHLNDSKGQLGSGLDRHENLGLGNIGMECFEFIMNDHRFNNIPLILETPDVNNDEKIYKKEISMLYDLVEISK
ncbi:apurinic endonuclease family protein [Cryptosporidium muris RN66]|uniref:Apurinic endonuclease family protein n=1 Tax=Cryptosporidium muris (strain RN66) TaxID=441375 RepID=B6AFX1_CRYMR|nr:apurinic endonuclease family protein [Cryptosporidium muris RN66]EEA07112.1 apurinic endonuclease family protein [Cryptosporidium muris RN66]|eukprot:XP_002141461.1 apurinic endonuclease family protein [Cryptosporidium muris RN66]